MPAGEYEFYLNYVKRPKLDSGERRSLIEETKESSKEQSEKIGMLKR